MLEICIPACVPPCLSLLLSMIPSDGGTGGAGWHWLAVEAELTLETGYV
jgi:hypothetical protein